MASEKYRPALIVVDFQEDFCPPNGSLAVPEGRSIAPFINSLLALPFPLKIATKDFHPADHVSFASNHQQKDPGCKPFTSSTTITHPADPSRSYTTTLWPIHCVQGTPGSELVPELDVSKIHHVIEKGQDARVEMYSAFRDPFSLSDSGLAALLRTEEVTHVFVVGLATDYCVKATAEHAAEEGYSTFIIEEATRPVVPDKLDECKKGIESNGVKFTTMAGEEVARVKAMPNHD
ncbi:nicotinamidase [Mariannaea sp. PMI_226]|nr:nicotinamidase [Mariannaea sp. PMI_226]